MSAGRGPGPALEADGRCVLYGVGSGYVHEVHEMLMRVGWEVVGLVANVEDVLYPESIGKVVGVSSIPADWLDAAVVIPLVTPGHRQSVEIEARAVGFDTFPSVVDPTSVVSPSASIAPGTTVNAGVVIGANSRLGPFTCVNRSASVGHDVDVSDFASIGPGSVLCGEVQVGLGGFVGAGAVILSSLTVGSNAVVGAGAVVVRDVEPNTVVVGNPARVIRTGAPGYNDVSVTHVSATE